MSTEVHSDVTNNLSTWDRKIIKQLEQTYEMLQTTQGQQFDSEFNQPLLGPALRSILLDIKKHEVICAEKFGERAEKLVAFLINDYYVKTRLDSLKHQTESDKAVLEYIMSLLYDLGFSKDGLEKYYSSGVPVKISDTISFL